MQCGGCLCACSQLAASQLISRLPALLRRERAVASGWDAYLTTIYGADVQYPVDLTQLRMLYLRTSIWQLNASSSSWPLLPCHARTGFGVIPSSHAAFGPNHAHLVGGDAPSENCTDASSLLAADVDSLATGEGLRLETYHAAEVRTNQIGLVAAIRWWWTAAAAAPAPAAPPADHATPLYSGAPDHGWVEVTRWACPVEGGRPRFGTWFARAPGSGIFVNVGRSYRIAAKGKFLPERAENGSTEPGSHQYVQLVDAWRISRGGISMETARGVVSEWAHNGSLQVTFWGENLPQRTHFHFGAMPPTHLHFHCTLHSALTQASRALCVL